MNGEKNKKEVSKEERRRLVVGIFLSFIAVLALSSVSMFLVVGLVNPEMMTTDEFREMAYELSSLTFKVSQSDSLFLSRMLSIPRVDSISFDIALIEEERVIMRLKTERISVAVYIVYEDGHAVGRYGKETFNIYYSKEDMTLIMKFAESGEVREFAAI